MLTSNGYVLDESPSRFGSLTATPDGERGDREALRARLARDGYLLLRAALDPETVLGFRRYYFESLAPSGLVEAGSDPVLGLAGSGTVDRQVLRDVLFGEVVPGARYEEFCTQPAIREFFAWLLGGQVFLHKRKILRHTISGVQRRGAATMAHYDLVYLRDGSDQVLSLWVPLGDCPIERGGLVYLEGSHRRMQAEEEQGTRRRAESMTADLPALADTYQSRWLAADYRAGDMVVHTAYMVHAALDNVDPGSVMRLSTDIRYQRADQAVDARWQNHWHDRDGL